MKNVDITNFCQGFAMLDKITIQSLLNSNLLQPYKQNLSKLQN